MIFRERGMKLFKKHFKNGFKFASAASIRVLVLGVILFVGEGIALMEGLVVNGLDRKAVGKLRCDVGGPPFNE